MNTYENFIVHQQVLYRSRCQQLARLLHRSKRTSTMADMQPASPGEDSISIAYVVQRGQGGLGVDVSTASEIVALVPGGRADQDGLMRIGDMITAIDGVQMKGRKLGSLIKPEAQAFEFTVDRHDPGVAMQLATLELPRKGVSYHLLKACCSPNSTVSLRGSTCEVESVRSRWLIPAPIGRCRCVAARKVSASSFVERCSHV